ncbi:PLP-dependent aminotransferase family protein [Limisalsivibrio acetivorans]|uniref:aminotransferase-like domain-containing protein n=1 Tax=Limisalsivibrio acetivorans TaxID=1304888 RepID=UPI0003B4B8D8|nr:PLP-dependent aminotransferase family protein [Limisalsivibrio acetivorans]
MRVKEQYRYEKVQERILELIRGGHLSTGDKVPSLRQMSREMGLSVTTVMKAYVDMEQDGILEAKPQSGFYVAGNSSIPSVQCGGERKIEVRRVDKFSMMFSVCNSMSNPDLVQFGGALPALDLLPSAELARTTKYILNNRNDYNSFEKFNGNPELRHNIAYLMTQNGSNPHRDDIIITSGATEGISHALRVLTKPGDIVAVETPLHFGYVRTLETLGVYCLEIPTSPETGMDIDSLDDMLQKHDIKAVLLQANFSNPLGCLMPEENKKRLVRLCEGRGVTVIEDDIYGELPHSETRPSSLFSYSETGDVIYVSSFSKTLAPSFRIGWVCPGRHYEEIMNMKLTTVLDTSRITQLAISDYLATGKYSRYIVKVRKTYWQQIARYRNMIAESFPEGTRITNPSGGYILWVELPGETDTFEVYRKAMEEGIGTVPGYLFTTGENYKNYMRINCGTPLNERYSSALKKLGSICADVAGA